MARLPGIGRRGLAVLIGAVTAAAFAGTQPQPARAAAADPFLSLTGRTSLSNDLLRGLDQLKPSGSYDPGASLTIGVSLQRPDSAGENAYLADVYDPKSPDFRHFLDAAGFAQRFGVSQARYDDVLAWLHQAGLATTSIPGSTEYVLASGPAAAVESLLDVHLETYSAGSRTFFANTSAPAVPANLGVLSIAGLQSLVHMRTLLQVHQAAVASGKEQPGAGPAAPSGPARASTLPPNIGQTTAQDLWSIYDQPNNNEGQGESMAIFGWGCTEPPGSAYDAAPVSTYYSQSGGSGTNQNTSACAGTDVITSLRNSWETPDGLPSTPIVIKHYGTASDPVNDTSGTGEWELDMPASTGMAPLADREVLYFGNNGQDPDILAAYNAWNADPNAPRQGSSSFAGCEATPLTGTQPGGPGNPGTGVIIGNPNQDAYEAALKEAVGLGHTMFNSAGDLGANGCPSNTDTALNGVTPSGTPINNYPSSSDYVTTVGGTVLYWNGACGTGLSPSAGCATRALENSWAYTGGGTSLAISAPSWQQNAPFTNPSNPAGTSFPGVSYPCTTNWEAPPNTGTYPPGTFCRGLPDVAAQSGDVISNGAFGNGGTSLSSPLWLGMWTRIQAASSNPGRLGFASAAIYATEVIPADYERDFFDIGGSVEAYNGGATNSETAPTVSTNTYFPQYDHSGSGWDFLSGWGTPDVTNLMKDLDNGNTAPVVLVPASNVPEAPVTPLLLMAPILAIGGVLLRRRRAA